MITPSQKLQVIKKTLEYQEKCSMVGACIRMIDPITSESHTFSIDMDGYKALRDVSSPNVTFTGCMAGLLMAACVVNGVSYDDYRKLNHEMVSHIEGPGDNLHHYNDIVPRESRIRFWKGQVKRLEGER